VHLLARLLLPLAALPLLAADAPSRPHGTNVRALKGVQPGLWDVSRSATGHQARRICFSDLLMLAEEGHGGERCERTVLVDRPGLLVLDLTCPRGEIGRARISVTTPRSLKVEVQGVHRSAPFNETLYARRAGACPPGRRQR
jgi:hypothetical protein